MDNSVVVEGDLTFNTVERYLNAAQGATPDQPLRIDLGAVSRVDSAGVALLVEWARNHSHGIELLGVSEQLAGLLAVYDLEELFSQIAS